MRFTKHFVLAYFALQLQMQQNSCFLYHSITYQTDQNLLSYHSISSLPTHTQGFSFTTHCLFSDSKAVFSVGGWPGDLTPPCTAYGRMHTGADAFFCTAGHPYCSSIPSSNSFSKQPTVQYARYCILVRLLLNQPWRTVSGVMVWEKGTHVWSEAHVSVGAHVVNRFTWSQKRSSSLV